MQNCNIMIKGPADHGLHMPYQLHLFVLKSYMPQSRLFYHCYKLFFVSLHRRYDLISLVPTRLHISTSFFWNKNPTHCMWAKTVCFNRRLIKTTCKPTPFWPRPGLILGTLTLASIKLSWRQSYIAMSCGNNARVEGLDVTLDDPVGYTRTDPSEWLDFREPTLKQYWKQIIITITISTQHRVRSRRDEDDTSSLGQKSRLSQRLDIKRLM